MIGGLYSKSDIEPGSFEGIGLDELLHAVGDSPVKTEIEAMSKADDGFFVSAHLPFDCFAEGSIDKCDDPSKNLFILHKLFVGDRRLIGTGTGARLVGALVAQALDLAPGTPNMHTGWTRLGAVNAINNAFPGRLKIKLGDSPTKHYGYGTGRPLEQVFTDCPPVQGHAYKVWATDTSLDGINTNDW